MSLPFHPGALLREKVQERITEFKSMNTNRVQRRAEGRMLCTAPLAVSLGLYANAVIHGQDPSTWRLAALGGFVLLLGAWKLFGGPRGIWWGMQLWALSFAPLFLMFGCLFLAGGVLFFVQEGRIEDGMLEVVGIAAGMALLGYVGKRYLERIEMGEQ